MKSENDAAYNRKKLTPTEFAETHNRPNVTIKCVTVSQQKKYDLIKRREGHYEYGTYEPKKMISKKKKGTRRPNDTRGKQT